VRKSMRLCTSPEVCSNVHAPIHISCLALRCSCINSQRSLGKSDDMTDETGPYQHTIDLSKVARNVNNAVRVQDIYRQQGRPTVPIAHGARNKAAYVDTWMRQDGAIQALGGTITNTSSCEEPSKPLFQVHTQAPSPSRLSEKPFVYGMELRLDTQSQ
jgi:hypothetical protein